MLLRVFRRRSVIVGSKSISVPTLLEKMFMYLNISMDFSSVNAIFCISEFFELQLLSLLHKTVLENKTNYKSTSKRKVIDFFIKLVYKMGSISRWLIGIKMVTGE